MVKLYTIFDKVVSKYRTPFFVASNNFDAIRMIKNSLDDPNNLLNKNMSDYSLYCVGEYDDEKSEFLGKTTKVSELSDIVSKERTCNG